MTTGRINQVAIISLRARPVPRARLGRGPAAAAAAAATTHRARTPAPPSPPEAVCWSSSLSLSLSLWAETPHHSLATLLHGCNLSIHSYSPLSLSLSLSLWAGTIHTHGLAAEEEEEESCSNPSIVAATVFAVVPGIFRGFLRSAWSLATADNLSLHQPVCLSLSQTSSRVVRANPPLEHAVSCSRTSSSSKVGRPSADSSTCLPGVRRTHGTRQRPLHPLTTGGLLTESTTVRRGGTGPRTGPSLRPHDGLQRCCAGYLLRKDGYSS